jgi:hypothetical protein
MSTNPLLDYQVAYALVLIWRAAAAASATSGFSKAWANLEVVEKDPWLG